MQCIACKRENPDDARFCNGCGRPLGTVRSAPARDRRPLTVLFADVVDSVRLAAALDPEDWRSVLVRYHTACRLAIHERGGLIRQYLGDGVLAYFGFPSAGETDAVNAIRAGLDLKARVADVARELQTEYGIDLDVRIGVHSGLVVVGEAVEGDAAETHAFGNTLNVAARLQGVAAPNTVVISADTLRLVEGLFVVESLGPRQLKGLPEPVEVLRIDREADVSHRLDSASPSRLSPFVGRSAELARVLEFCERPESQTSVLLIQGEAGVGKSRLLREARNRLTSRGHPWLQGRCLPDTQHSPFASWRRLLQTALGLGTHSAPEATLAKLESAGAQLGLGAGSIRRMAELLGALPAAAAPSLAADRRRQTIDALVEWMRSQAERRPMVVSIEDLHWADPSTLAVLAQARLDLVNAAVTFVLTTRPGAGSLPPPAEELLLGGLGGADARELALALGGDALTDDVLETLLERGSGLPLYLEELLRDAVSTKGERFGVPAGLRISLTSRLDQLGPARELAQMAAVIGGEAPVRLLAQIGGWSESQVLDEASEIVAAGLASWSHGSDGPALRFAHALMADAAYDSVPKERRRALHADVGDHLAAVPRAYPPERIAPHYELAEDYARAMDLWRRACRGATRAYALDEAGAHRDRALACLSHIRGGADPAAEMKLRLAEIDYLNVRHGFTGDEQADAFARVTELVDDEAVDRTSRFVALLKLTTQTAALSRMEESNLWADRCEALAAEAGSPLFMGFLGAPAGTARLLTGRYAEARRITRDALAALDVESPVQLDARIAEAWTMTLCILAHAHAALGSIGEARDCLDRAIEGARAVEPPDPFALGQVLYFRAMLLLMEGELDPCCRDALEMKEIGDRYGFAETAAAGRMFEACREMEQGDAARGVADFRVQEASVPHYKPFAHLHQMMFEAMARAGALDEAIEGATAHYEALVGRGELICSEEFHGLVAELRFARDGELEAARRGCARGLAEAAERGAHGPRLRIALRLARLLDGAGRRDGAAAALEDALRNHPDPRSSRRYREAAELLDRFRGRVRQAPQRQGAPP